MPALLLLLLVTVAAGAQAAEIPPPVAKRIPHATTLHGERRVDDYAWLRDKANPDVLRHLEAENAYTEQAMAPTRDLQEALYQEMLGRIQQTDLSVPYLQGGFYYYSRTEEGKQYPIHCRKPGSLEAPEQVVLDLNLMAEGHSFFSLGAYQVSDDGSTLAYSTDTTGFRVYDLHVRDLASGRDLPDHVRDVGSVAWAADGRTLFYTVKDAAKRNYRLYRHRLGAAQDLILEEKDERFEVSVHRTRSRAYLVCTVESHTTSEVRFLPAGDPGGSWTAIVQRRQDREIELDHQGEWFYLRTNDRGRNFRVARAPVADPRPERWEEVTPHRDGVMIERVECFARHWVRQEREDGLVRLVVTALPGGESHGLSFPEPVYSASISINREFDTGLLRYSYESFTTPASIYDYDMEARTATLKKRTPVLGGYDPSLYESRRLHAVAKDGTRIPVSLVRRKGGAGPRPMLLYAYGAYGAPLSASFSSNRLSLLDRGVTFAIAHVRGGGELGKAWHDHGRMFHKRNTFTDFLAVAEHLIHEGLTSRDRLAIQGGSAGGLTMGAVVNLRPDLFRAVVSQVPFVDVINTMSDASLPLTVGEFEEWGDPRKKDEYEYMKSYCPYTNLGPRSYPAMLVKTSLHDSQVMYWEPAKYVARLRAVKQDDRPLLFRINMAAGHGGASGRYDALRELAFDYAFVLDQLGLARPAVPRASQP